MSQEDTRVEKTEGNRRRKKQKKEEKRKAVTDLNQNQPALLEHVRLLLSNPGLNTSINRRDLVKPMTGSRVSTNLCEGATRLSTAVVALPRAHRTPALIITSLGARGRFVQVSIGIAGGCRLLCRRTG